MTQLEKIRRKESKWEEDGGVIQGVPLSRHYSRELPVTDDLTGTPHISRHTHTFINAHTHESNNGTSFKLILMIREEQTSCIFYIILMKMKIKR